MKQIRDMVRQIVNGNYKIDNSAKYKTIEVNISLIHLIFSIIFAKYDMMTLFWYNLFITFFYLYHSSVSVKKERYRFLYFSSYVEIIAHAVVATLLLGWEWNFMTYTVALIPVAFYLTYTIPKLKKKIGVPIGTSVIIIVCYLSVRLICEHIPALYDVEHLENIRTFMSYFNTMITFVIMLTFSILFSVEIRYMQAKLERENSKLGEIANYDPLTHLLNRRSMNKYLQQRMDEVLEKQMPFCLIMADIDNFKNINDTYGHDGGDAVLVAVANAIVDGVREEDCVCRWGGEEVLILLQAEKEMAVQAAQRICDNIASKQISYKEQQIQVTITMGVASYKEGMTIHTMIEQADQNLYYGKKNGKNQVVA